MDNTTRALSQAVSIDGWIGEFDENGLANVHTDVVFRQGTFGDDPESQIRFKIALKRAEIVLRIPNGEPLKVDKKTVQRTIMQGKGKLSSEVTTKTGVLGKIKGAIGLKPAFSAEGEAFAEHSSVGQISIEKAFQQCIVQHFITADGNYAWETKAQEELGPYLDGGSWDPVEEPRLKVKKTLPENATGDLPTIIIEVRCAREDIEVIDFEEKNPEQQRLFSSKNNHHKNLAAAEQLIKDELQKSGFMEIADLSEKVVVC